MKSNVCPICGGDFERLMKHISRMHRDLYQEQCAKAVMLFSAGMTLRQIGASDLTYWSFGKALGDVIRKSKTSDELAVEKKRRIKNTLLIGYEQGAYKLTGRGRKASGGITSALTARPTEVLEWKGNKLNKSFIATLSDSDRAAVKAGLIEYIDKCELCDASYPDSELIDEFGRVSGNHTFGFKDGVVDNINSVGSKIYKHFFPGLLKMRGAGGKQSIYDALHDHDSLGRILDNRLDPHIQKLFSGNITKNMIIQGAKSSGLGFRGSQFKPLVAKAIYDLFVKDGWNVLDYSAGFGSRLLGLAASNPSATYYAYEPNSETYAGLLKMRDFFGFKAEVKCCGSECELFEQKMDFAFSSPPYFDYEIYSDEPTQCYNKYSDYDHWLKEYWKQTVLNAKQMLKSGALFGINIGNDSNDKMRGLRDDMLSVICSCGFKLEYEYAMRTPISHLANKSGKYATKNEGLYFFAAI